MLHNIFLDRKCVVFGKLIDGLEVLKKIESVGNEEGKPDVTVKIINCGELPDGETSEVPLLLEACFGILLYCCFSM